MMGNAMIQPTMYFNLRNIPMFSGPYMITNIQHRISDNGFDTTFEGQRQPFYSIPAIDSLLQSLTSKILETLKERIEEQDKEKNEMNNILQQKSDVVNKINNSRYTLTTNQNCSANLNSSFNEYTITTPSETKISFEEAVKKITNKVNATSLSTTYKNKLGDFILITMFLETGDLNSFVAKDYNYAGVNLNINPWGGSLTSYLNKKYYCTNRGQIQNIPLASFNSFDDFLDFFIAKFRDKVGAIQDYKYDDGSYKEKLAKAYVLKWPATLEDNVWDDLPQNEKNKIQEKVGIPMEYLIQKYK